MALSGSRDFSMDRDTLIKMAFRKIGGLSTGGTPLNSQITEGSLALNVLINEWVNDHIPIWVTSVADYALTANTPTIAIETTTKTILDIQLPYLRKNNQDWPLRKLTREEYNKVIDKAEVGDPRNYFLDVQLSSLTMYLYPVPEYSTSIVTATDTFAYVAKQDHTSTSDDQPITGTDYADYWERSSLTTSGAWVTATDYYSARVRGTRVYRIQDMDATDNNFDFTPNAYRALLYNLAVDLAPEFGNVKRELDKLKEMAKELKLKLIGYNHESGDVSVSPEL